MCVCVISDLRDHRLIPGSLQSSCLKFPGFGRDMLGLPGATRALRKLLGTHSNNTDIRNTTSTSKNRKSKIVVIVPVR